MNSKLDGLIKIVNSIEEINNDTRNDLIEILNKISFCTTANT
jgi:hypothetical protein